MKKLFPISLLVVLLVFHFSSCKDDEPVPEDQYTTYLILSEGDGVRGQLSAYDAVSGKMLSKSFKPTNPDGSKLLTHVVTDGVYAYTLNESLDYIEKVSLESFASEKMLRIYRPEFSGSQTTFMSWYNDQLVLAGITSVQQDGNWKDIAFLRFYDADLNKIDSIVVNDVDYLYDMIIADDKIFVSTGTDGSPIVKEVQVFEFSTKAWLRTFLAERAVYLVDRMNGSILAVIPNKAHTINTQSLEITSITNFSKTNYTSSGAQAVGDDGNTLYYFTLASQPSSQPYYLASITLSNGQNTDFAATSEGFVGPPILLDGPRNHIILSDGNNKVRVFSTGGVLQKEFQVSGNVVRIIGYKSPV